MAKPTAEELDLVTQLRHQVQDLELTSDQSSDYQLLKWIRARHPDLRKAEQMLRKSVAWRRENGIDNVLRWTPPKIITDSWKIVLEGCDSDNSPILISYVGRADLATMLRMGLKDDMCKFIVHWLEKAVEKCKGILTPEGSPVTQFVIMVDFDGLPISVMFVPGFTSFWLEVVRILEANYPEAVRRLIGVNSSKLASMLYSLAKPFLSEVTAKKVLILGTGCQNVGERLIESIPPDQICSRYGGTRACDYEFCCKAMNREDETEDTGMKTVVIKAGEKMSVPVDVIEPNSVISWSFYTTNYNIHFDVTLNGAPLISTGPVESHEGRVEGTMVCERPGLYALQFDNTYSKLRSKELMYVVGLAVPSKRQ